MTYCLGWKTKTSAFLIADSAVTRRQKIATNEIFLQNTSFGEIQGNINNGEKYVYEKSLKLHSIDKIAITFAGDAEFGSQFIGLIKDNLDYYGIKTAIQNSINNYPDFLFRPHIQIIVACCENEPTIYSIDNRKSPEINTIDEFVAFGSPPEHLKTHTLSFFDGFKKSREDENDNDLADEIFLLRMLSLLQTYGIHCYTMENGIGGTYSGLYINAKNIYWQPDIFYLIHNENVAFEKSFFVAVYIRENYEFIITQERNIALKSYLKGFSDETESLYNEVSKLFDNGKFKYVIFLNFKRHCATILHMNYQYHHHYFSIDVENKNATIGFLTSDKLSKIINANYSNSYKEPNYALIQYSVFNPR